MATVAFDDVAKELEWQKTNLALGHPVDAELLIEVCGQLQGSIDEAKEEARAAAIEQEAAEDGERDAEKSRDDITELLASLTVLMRSVGQELVEKKVAVKLGKSLVDAANDGDRKAEELVK